MKHPFLNHIRIYLLLWLAVAVSHAVVLHQHYRLSLLHAVSDGFIYNTLYAALALNFWHTVRYLNIEKRSPVTLIVVHFISAFLFLFLWMIVGNYAITLISANSEAYQEFVRSSLLVRSISGLLYYFIIILVYYLFIYYYSFREKLTREADLRALVKDTELSLLRSQLNPHFIFNSLNSISALTISNSAKAQEMIIKLSAYLRYAIEYSKNDLVSFEQELENSLLYLDIEKIRFGEKLRFNRDIAKDCPNTSLPNMILQPLLENAIKHGVYESLSPVDIQLSAQLQKDFLCIKISNTFEKDRRSSSRKGIGLYNVKERLFLLYGKKELLKTSSEGATFEVELMIPQNKSLLSKQSS